MLETCVSLTFQVENKPGFDWGFGAKKFGSAEEDNMPEFNKRSGYTDRFQVRGATDYSIVSLRVTHTPGPKTLGFWRGVAGVSRFSLSLLRESLTAFATFVV